MVDVREVFLYCLLNYVKYEGLEVIVVFDV